MRKETFNEEKLIERKGIILQLHLDYIIKYLFIFLLCYQLYKNDFLMQGSVIGIFAEKPQMIISILKLTAFTFIFTFIMENSIFNLSFIEEDNKWSLLIQHSVSVFLAICVSIRFIPEITVGNILSIMLISIYIGFLKAQFEIKYFDIIDFITITGIFLTAHFYSYGIRFNGLVSAIVVVLTMYVATVISKYIYSKLLVKNALKNIFRINFLYVLTQIIFFSLINLLVSGCVLFIFDKFKVINVVSYLQILSLFIFYMIVQFKLNLYWSKTHKKTQSRSYSRTYI